MKQIKRRGWRQTAVSLPIRGALLCAGGFATVPAAARRCDLESVCAVPCERSRKSLRTITPLCARWSSRLRIVGEALQQALALQVVLVHLLFEHRQLCRHGGVWRCDRVMPSRLTARRNTAPEMPYSSFPFPD